MAVVVALPTTCMATQCVDDALAMVTAKQALEFGSRQLDGILGSDALTRDVTIDYSRPRFDWSGGTDARRAGDRLPLSVEDGRAIVTMPQGRAGQFDWLPTPAPTHSSCSTVISCARSRRHLA